MRGRYEGSEGRGEKGSTREGSSLLGHRKHLALTLSAVGAMRGFEQ